VSDQEKVSQLLKMFTEQVTAAYAREKESLAAKRDKEAALRAGEKNLADLEASLTARAKLDVLCRTLHADLGTLRARLKTSEDANVEERRKDHERLSASIESIQAQIAAQDAKSQEVIAENVGLRESLAKFSEHSQKVEAHHDALVKKLSLETQLAQAQYAQQEELCKRKDAVVDAAVKEAHAVAARNKELETLLSKVGADREQMMAVVSKSNETFKEYKKMMDETAKQTKRLEKDRKLTEEKCTLLTAIKDKQDAELAALRKKVALLENLCRTLNRAEKEGLAIPEGLRSAAADLVGPAATAAAVPVTDDADAAAASSSAKDDTKPADGNAELTQ
jgi:hypothetical protein